MSGPDEEYIDPHGECAAEIHRLMRELAEALSALSDLLDNKSVTYGVRAARARAIVERYNVASPTPPQDRL